MDSKTLAQGLRTADPIIIEKIYNGPIGKNIKNIVLRHGGNQFDAENILTPTIMAAIDFFQKGQYVEMDRCEGLLYAIAKKRWMKEKERKGWGIWKRSKFIEIDEAFLGMPTDDVDFLPLDDEIKSAKERAYLLKHINKLDGRCQELLKLRYLEGYQLNEIEQIMGLSKNYPNVQIKRCIKKLRKLIDEKLDLD